VLFASTLQQVELPHLAKLIVRTVHYEPAEPFFPSYALSIEEMNRRSEGAVLASWKETIAHDSYHKYVGPQTS
jgi:hypothetical protein